tara:strand:- start:1639 stop:1968 length:330 start_codon:yes stop_codon:yes gene_type:complete
MPYKEKEITKKYFTIGEVAQKFEINTSQLRFWESEFEILNPKKNKKGSRKYRLKDVEIIKKIHDLLKIDGFTIEGAKKKLARKTIFSDKKIINQLEKIKEKLIRLKNKV